eukprot:gene4469-6717_t
MYLAMNGNYREGRWFTPWRKHRTVEDFMLPPVLRKATGQRSAPFGDGVIATNDVCIGSEVCEELWSPNSPHIHMGLDGVDIFTNGSGSHHELRKLNHRLDLIRDAVSKVGGVYLYANSQGNDGERVYYDGCAVIAVNDKIIAQGSQFSLNDVEVITATIDIDDVRTYRGSLISLADQASVSNSYPRITAPYDICMEHGTAKPTRPVDIFIHSPEEEIALGPACWLWDYLRRSGLGGFFLPLSGGLDSSSTASIVCSMCHLVFNAIQSGNMKVLNDIRQIVREESFTPASPKDIAGRIFYTMYMGTTNSSNETRQRACNLAEEIGAVHLNVDIDSVVSAVTSLFTLATGKALKFKVFGGSVQENLALQNIQARIRMVLAYLFGAMLPWCHGKPSSLLVLGSANVDECLRGYMTKYDCSSADINPIGGISKVDLRRFAAYATTTLNLKSLQSVLDAKPTAELEPITVDYTQSDEEDMGMTYDELSVFGRLRKISKCGPYSMFCKLVDLWGDALSVRQIADKVKFFFRMYAINRHKSTVLTPAYHAENYAPDDNRFDLRQFLYNTRWPLPFECIDEEVTLAEHRVESRSHNQEN